MLGEKLKDLGYGTGLYKVPPYYAVKVPVFSFEKLTDANSILGPEMKSTGEVLGIGKTMPEALFKGLSAAGFSVPSGTLCNKKGVLFSVEEHDYEEVISLAKSFFDEGLVLYATSGTANAIKKTGVTVTTVANATENDDISHLMESGVLSYIIYTGAVKDSTVGDYTLLHTRAMQLGIPCLTSLDTAGALAKIIESRFSLSNTELVDINNMRQSRKKIHFSKEIPNYISFKTIFESLLSNLQKPKTTLENINYFYKLKELKFYTEKNIIDSDVYRVFTSSAYILASFGLSFVELKNCNIGNNSKVPHLSYLGDATIGNKVNIQDGAVIHTLYKRSKTTIGNNVSIGHNATIHGATIEDNCLIGMGATVLDNAVIESGAIVAANALVTSGMRVEGGFIYAGVPAKKVKDSSEAVYEAAHKNAQGYLMYKEWYK